MEKRILGKTNLEVSALGFGGGPVGFLGTDRKQVAQVLNGLLDKGVNLIDTAAVYLGSEEAIGAAVAQRRDEYVLVSKCGQAFDDIDGDAWSPLAIQQTIDRSLRRLQTDHIDVMLLHSCDLATLKAGDALGALVDARDAGKIRYIGYSGDNDAAAYAAALDEVAVLEISVNICDQANIDSVLPAAQRHNVGVLAKRPIANAAWREASEQSGIYVDYAKSYSQRLASMGIEPATFGFTGTAGAAWSELALRFTLSVAGVTTAIVGTTQPSNVERNLEVVARGALPDKVVADLRDAFRRAENEAGETWLALT